mgnify:CR=1 FL=1|tara:strand:+ start:3002 stop:3241 length:240 start_codon:yes stop_codon:yes gene_type:complete
MQEAFEQFLKNNPELLDSSRKPYFKKNPEREKEFVIALQKYKEGYPRKAIVKWLKESCGWSLAEKTISDYIGDYGEKTE